MSSTNKTANFKLSQFIGTDKPTFLGDYNNDMKIIDGALFTASQTAEEAVNEVETVKSAQADLKAVHEDIKKQVAQLKETADGMTGDVTAAQEAANRAEQKATAAQTAATDVVNAANAASANATKAKQTADGNKTTIAELDRRVTALESAPKPSTEVVFKVIAVGASRPNTGTATFFYKNHDNMTLIKMVVSNVFGTVNVQGLTRSATIQQGSAPVTYTESDFKDERIGIGRPNSAEGWSTAEVDLTYRINA